MTAAPCTEGMRMGVMPSDAHSVRRVRSEGHAKEGALLVGFGNVDAGQSRLRPAIHFRPARRSVPGGRLRLSRRTRSRPGRGANQRKATLSASTLLAAHNMDSCSKKGNTPASIFPFAGYGQRSPTASTRAERSLGNTRFRSTIPTTRLRRTRPSIAQAPPILPASKVSITGAANSQP